MCQSPENISATDGDVLQPPIHSPSTLLGEVNDLVHQPLSVSLARDEPCVLKGSPLPSESCDELLVFARPFP